MLKDESIREKMFVRIASWQSSDLSQREWCRQQDIAYHIFHYWYRKYKEAQNESAGESSFIRLSVKREAAAGCEVIFSDGTKMVFREPVLRVWIERKEIVLYVPGHILEEWDRRKIEKLAELEKKVENIQRDIRKKRAFNIDFPSNGVEIAERRLKDQFTRIDDLLKAGVSVTTSNAASELIVKQKEGRLPPFRVKLDSDNDAAIIFSTI